MINAIPQLNIVTQFKNKVYKMYNEPDSITFTTFSKSYKNSEILAYFNYIYQQIERKSPTTIVYAGENTIESIIITFFLIFSKHRVFILPSDFRSGSKLYDEVIKLNQSYLYLCHDTIILETCIEATDHISAISLEQFIKDVHPVARIDKFLENFFDASTIRQDKIFSSSGSTGTPKLIPLSTNNIDACFNACVIRFFSRLEYLNIICLHATSFVIILPYLFAFVNESCNAKVRAVSQEYSLFPLLQYGKCFHKYSDSLVISVPTMLKALHSIVEESNYKFFGLNLISCGEPLASSLTKNLLNFKPNSFLNLYGCTEVSPWIFALDVIKFVTNKPIAPVLPVGSPLPNVNCKINTKGELLVSSPSVFEGYLNHDNSCLCKEEKGTVYFNTSDLFEIKDTLYVCNGRSNSVVKLAGTYVNPILIEAILKNHYSHDDLIAIPNCESSTLKIHFFNSSDCFVVNNNTSKSYIRGILRDQLSSSVILNIQRHQDPPNKLSSGKINRKYYLSNAN